MRCTVDAQQIWISLDLIWPWNKTVNVYCHFLRNVNCFWSSVFIVREKNAFIKSLAIDHILEVVLSWSNEDTTSGTVPVSVVIFDSACGGLQWPFLIHPVSSGTSLVKQTRMERRSRGIECGNNLHSRLPQYDFTFIYLFMPGERVNLRLHLAFPHMILLILQNSHAMWVLAQLLNRSPQLYIWGLGNGPLGGPRDAVDLCKLDIGQDYSYYLAPAHRTHANVGAMMNQVFAHQW